MLERLSWFSKLRIALWLIVLLVMGVEAEFGCFSTRAAARSSHAGAQARARSSAAAAAQCDKQTKRQQRVSGIQAPSQQPRQMSVHQLVDGRLIAQHPDDRDHRQDKEHSRVRRTFRQMESSNVIGDVH
jgi:hypothetical protein